MYGLGMVVALRQQDFATRQRTSCLELKAAVMEETVYARFHVPAGHC